MIDQEVQSTYRTDRPSVRERRQAGYPMRTTGGGTWISVEIMSKAPQTREQEKYVWDIKLCGSGCCSRDVDCIC